MQKRALMKAISADDSVQGRPVSGLPTDESRTKTLVVSSLFGHGFGHAYVKIFYGQVTSYILLNTESLETRKRITKGIRVFAPSGIPEI